MELGVKQNLSEWGQKVNKYLDQGLNPTSASILALALSPKIDIKKKALELGLNAANVLVDYYMKQPIENPQKSIYSEPRPLNQLPVESAPEQFTSKMKPMSRRDAYEVNNESVNSELENMSIRSGEKVSNSKKDMEDAETRADSMWREGIQDFRQNQLISALNKFQVASTISKENPFYAKDTQRTLHKINFLKELFGNDFWDEQIKEEQKKQVPPELRKKGEKIEDWIQNK